MKGLILLVAGFALTAYACASAPNHILFLVGLASLCLGFLLIQGETPERMRHRRRLERARARAQVQAIRKRGRC